MDLILKLTFTALLFMVCEGKVMLDLTIQSYSNPNGTCSIPSSSDRKCCDGPQRPDCSSDDTCDTYLDICVGRMPSGWECEGASFHTVTFSNTNFITNVTLAQTESNIWVPDTILRVFILDDDSIGNKHQQVHEHIDTLIDLMNFDPAPVKETATPHAFGWVGETSLNVTITAWCADDYYGKSCDTYCSGLEPMAICDSSGNLVCQPSDTMLVEFLDPVNETLLPDLVFGVNRFFEEQVCGPNFTINYPELHSDSNTLSFDGTCGSRTVTPLEFESLLRIDNSKLTKYFAPRVITGPSVITQGYGEHIVSNVYVGIELKNIQNPTGTSYNGNTTSGSRRCCDVPRTDQCDKAADKCDLQAAICIGEILNGACIGAVTISPTYSNSTSVSTCGPALLDLTNNETTPLHPMIGGFRLAKNTTTIQIVVKDNDFNGTASDVIDILMKNITVTPGPNVTDATTVQVVMNNIASVTLRLIFWCAAGHSGPHCLANQGIDECESGWYGDACEFQLNACSPNPCKHKGVCTVLSQHDFNCTCDPGYTGSSCELDVNECALGVCQNNGTCINTVGAFHCVCPSLWTGIICTDYKDPACDPNPCAHGQCTIDVTTPEHYMCTCDHGWDSANCNTKVECSSVLCVNGVCRPENGVNNCICHQGYKGASCEQDINECLSNPCQNGASCHNSVGNFTCECTDGYGGNLCQNTVSACQGIVCQHGGTCIDIGGGISLCKCVPEFSGDKCELPVHVICNSQTCKHNGTCPAMMGGTFCDCPSSWSGLFCDTDVNECAKQDTCKNEGLCSNLPGSFNCDCPLAWSGNDCSIDTDECNGPSVTCLHGQCVNLPGTYKCNCDADYTGPNCSVRLNYCINQTCGGHGQCQELPTNYKCACNSGYTGSDCGMDINECAANVCGANALNCTYLPGTYNCTCKQGWQGTNCTVDVNECVSTSVIPCSGNGICSNLIGSYKCDCFPGFSGPDCSNFINTCKTVTCNNNGSCIVRNSETKCACTSGWTGISCEEDVNECENDFPCKNAGICQNTEGSFYCRCFGGWTGNVCQTDVNECLTPICQNKAICRNNPGSYQCACQTGWIGMNCEIEKINSMKGSILTFVFQHNISQAMIQPTLTYTNMFLSSYVCRNSTVTFLEVSIRDNTLQFKSQCNKVQITKASVTTALHNIPNDTALHLFPSPLIQVYESSVGPTLTSTSNKQWIVGHWPVIAGPSGAFVVVVAVAVFVIIMYRRRKVQASGESFPNPSYDVHYSEMSNYR